MKEFIAMACDFCEKIYKDPRSCRSHEYKCYYNPKTKSCATCEQFLYVDPGYRINNYVGVHSCQNDIPIYRTQLRTNCEIYVEDENKPEEWIDDPISVDGEHEKKSMAELDGSEEMDKLTKSKYDTQVKVPPQFVLKEKKRVIYVFYHRESEELTVATNLKAIEECSGVKYHRLRLGLQNGHDRIDTKEYIIFKTELIKGKQTAPVRKTEEPKSSQGPAPEPDDSGDLFDKLLKRDL